MLIEEIKSTMKPKYLEHRQEEIKRLQADFARLKPGSTVLELGCGHGHFLTALASRDKAAGKPRVYVGADKNDERIEKANKKSSAAQVEIVWLEALVTDVVALWPQANPVEEIFVLFPDPWPKLKQQKNRFMNAALLEALAKISNEQTRLFFRSDHFGYVAEVRECIKASTLWQLDEAHPWPAGLPSTVFEGHHPVYDSVVGKRR